MPYVNDLGDEVVSISGWLGMDGELSAITKTIGVTTPKERLQELLRMWLDNTESPTAPHTWENFVRVIRGVGKGHVADRIVEDLFTGDNYCEYKVLVFKFAGYTHLFGHIKQVSTPITTTNNLNTNSKIVCPLYTCRHALTHTMCM